MTIFFQNISLKKRFANEYALAKEDYKKYVHVSDKELQQARVAARKPTQRASQDVMVHV